MPPGCPCVKPPLAESASVAAGGLALACSQQGSHPGVVILNKQKGCCDLGGSSHQVISEFLLKGEAVFLFCFVSFYFAFSPLLI